MNLTTQDVFIETEGTLKNYVEIALWEQEKEISLPFIVFDKLHGKYAGRTRCMNIGPSNKVHKIGATCIGKEFQGTGLHGQMKFLKMNDAFDDMGYGKLGFRIWGQYTFRKGSRKIRPCPGRNPT